MMRLDLRRRREPKDRGGGGGDEHTIPFHDVNALTVRDTTHIFILNETRQ